MTTTLRPALFLLISLSLMAAQTTEVRVTVARAGVRQAPSEVSAVLTHVTYGKVLEVRGDEGDWYRVVAPVGSVRIEGYLSKRVAALVSANGVDAATAPAVVPIKVPGISIAADAGGKTTWLPPVATRVVPLAAPYGVLSDLSVEPLMTALSGLTPLPSDPSAVVTWVWAARRVDAPVLANRRPSFFASYRDAPGVNIADITVAVIKLMPAGAGWSLVGLTRHSAGAAESTDADWTISRELEDEPVKTTIRGTATGVMDVQLGSPLAPGSYAVVLRPFFPRKYAGRDVLGNDGIGLLFSYIWPFTIK